MFGLIKIGLSLKKWGGLAFGLFSKFRIYFIAGGLLLGFFTVQHYRIKSKDKKIQKLSVRVETLEYNNQQITEYNEIEHANTLKCLEDYSTLSGELINAKGRNETAVNNIEALKSEHNEKIKVLKAKILPVTVCDDAFIDDDFIDLMREN